MCCSHLGPLPVEQMKYRTIFLGSLLTLAAACAAIYYRFAPEIGGTFDPVASVSRPRPRMSAAFAETFTHLRAVERIKDPFQRCMAFPDPPWLPWDHDVIAAFCKSRTFKHITLDEIKSALDNGKPELVDAAFASYLAENFSTPEKHGILTRTYREVFFTESQQERDIVEHWVTLAPKSAFALAARGAYYFAVADEARGGGSVRETPEENFRSMRELNAKALADLREAVRREPKLTPAYDTMIFVGRANGDKALVKEALETALAIDPTDERFYLDWMAASEPRWGGSLDQMARVAQEAEKHADANPLLKLLTEKQRAYFGLMETQRYNYQPALAYFEQAFSSGPSTVDLATAAYVASMLGDHEKAIWYYSESIRFELSASADDLNRRAAELRQLGRPDLAADDLNTAASDAARESYAQAKVFEATHHYPEAEKIYLKVLEQNARNQDALEDLSNLYIGPLKEPVKAEPLVSRLQQFYPTAPRTWLITASLAKGRDEKICHAALRRYLELVDENDPNEKQYIDMARARVMELDKQVIPTNG